MTNYLDDVKNMYEVNFGEEGRRYNRNRPQYDLALTLLRRIPNVENAKILDLGCGLGEFADIMQENFPRTKIICIDGAEMCYNFVKQRGYEAYRVNLEYETIPLSDGYFDVVVSLEVIEHIWNTQHYLSEIKRVLKTGGYVIFTTPNYNYYRFRIYHLLGKFEYCLDERHKRYYTSKSIRKLLEKYFDIIEVIGSCLLPNGTRFIARRLINLLCINVGVLARKI